MPESIVQTVAAIARGETSATRLLDESSAAGERHADLNPFAFVDWQAARAQAQQLDEEARAGRLRGRLHGVPVSIKDLYAVKGMPMAAGTRARLPALGQEEATAVTRLRDEGALIFAKTNMHEIALGATGENLWTGDVKNPHDPSRQAGGSSSGAGVCVATGIGMGAIGSDTGGSVRIPAAFCGVAGFKPTFGAIPLAGALHLSWSCDHAGPLARSVADCAVLYEVMSQRRASHGAVPHTPHFVVPEAWLKGRLHAGVRAAFESLLASLRAVGVTLRSVLTPSLPLAWEHYTNIVRAEGAWVHREALAAGGQGFSEMVLPPLKLGLQIGAQDYLSGVQARDVLARELARLLGDCDAMILPTTAVPAPLRGQTEVEVERGKVTVREAVLGMTMAFSWCGLPTLSIPFARLDGMPLGLQIVGRSGADAKVLAIGSWLEARVAAASTGG